MNKRILFSLALSSVLGLACQKQAPPAPPAITAPKAAAASTGGVDPAKTVATIDGQEVKMAEVDELAKADLGRADAEHAERVHGIRSQALTSLVEKRLIEKKAKAENITPEQLIEREVNAKAPKPTDKEIQELYDRTKASGRPLPPIEQVREDITKFLTGRKSQDIRDNFINGLKAASKVEIKLPPLLLPKVQVAAEGPSKGEASAPVTIVEFSDFECPFCSRAEESVKKVMEAYKGKVRLFYRDFPLPFHSKAQKASEAALCAGEQGKYWEMHETLFANQQALEVPALKEHAKKLSLDGKKFNECLDSGRTASQVEASKKAGEAVGVTGTPAFFINGRMISGAQPFEKFKEVIDNELAGG
ncbi:MAG: thioredoxin domain-containing protein [Deltaproteobacteria bacterium]|nr:thioredoxin domain-containing protein [Deltaproteobacteria bacterium]